jgi:hypothetical protein
MNERASFSGSLCVAYGVAAVANGVLVIVKESAATVKHAMAGALGHHWPAHALLLLVLFALVAALAHGASVSRKLGIGGVRAAWLLVGSTAVSFAMISGFYIWHYFSS